MYPAIFMKYTKFLGWNFFQTPSKIQINVSTQRYFNMKIFKDVFSGDELFSDTYRLRLVNDVAYEIYGKHISRAWADVQLEGSNASTEEPYEGTGETSETGIDVVLNHRLVETCFRTKKD